jgi:hypothetical protein
VYRPLNIVTAGGVSGGRGGVEMQSSIGPARGRAGLCRQQSKSWLQKPAYCLLLAKAQGRTRKSKVSTANFQKRILNRER